MMNSNFLYKGAPQPLCGGIEDENQYSGFHIQNVFRPSLRGAKRRGSLCLCVRKKHRLPRTTYRWCSQDKRNNEP